MMRKISINKTNKNVNLVKDDDFNTPDRSHGDLYCTLCESHMNSEAMWQAHIIGKKHIKNINKDGDIVKKYEVLKQPCCIEKELEEISQEPVVGLKHIDEIYRKGVTAPIFMCYLCNSNVCVKSLLIEHILSYKHRLAYIKENDASKLKNIDNDSFSKSALEGLIRGFAVDLEQKNGRGSITVKKEIEKQEPSYTWPAVKPPKPPMTPPIEDYPEYMYKRKHLDHFNGDKLHDRHYSQHRGLRERSYSPPAPRYRERSYSPPRRQRRSRSPHHKRRKHPDSPTRRHYKHSYSKKSIKKNKNKDKKKKKEISHRNPQSRSNSSSSSRSSSNELNQHPSVEISESIHNYETHVRNPSFNVMHRSPVQPTVPCTKNFLSTGVFGELSTSVRQALFTNNSNTETVLNTGGATYEDQYAAPHLILDNLIQRQAERSILALEKEYRFDDIRTMVLKLSTDQFFNIVCSKLDQMPSTVENDRMLKLLYEKIVRLLRGNFRAFDNVGGSVAVPSSSVSNYARSTTTFVDAVERPLDKFLSISGMKFGPVACKSAQLTVIPGLDTPSI